MSSLLTLLLALNKTWPLELGTLPIGNPVAHDYIMISLCVSQQWNTPSGNWIENMERITRLGSDQMHNEVLRRILKIDTRLIREK